MSKEKDMETKVLTIDPIGGAVGEVVAAVGGRVIDLSEPTMMNTTLSPIESSTP